MKRASAAAPTMQKVNARVGPRLRFQLLLRGDPFQGPRAVTGEAEGDQIPPQPSAEWMDVLRDSPGSHSKNT